MNLVGEGDGSAKVCVRISSISGEGLQTDFIVSLDLSDGTKTRENKYMNSLKNSYCSIAFTVCACIY